MNLTKYFFLCSLFVCVIVCIKMEDNSSGSKDPPISHIHTRQLLESCFSDRLNPVAITSNLTKIIEGIQQNERLNYSVITINDNLLQVYRKKYGNRKKNTYSGYNSYPSYVLSADSVTALKRTLNNIRLWDPWNSERLIFAVGTRCSDASKVLILLWEYDVLLSYFICPNEFNNNTSIYTLNPYPKRAPLPWIKIEAPEKPPDPWTLYQMTFVNDEKLCPSITFDKTEALDGHRLQIQKSTVALKNTHTFYDIILSFMNVTPVAHKFSRLKFDSLKLQDPSLLREKNAKVSNIIPFYQQRGFVIVTQKQRIIPTFNQVVDNFFTYQNIIMSSVILVFIFGMILVNHKYDFGAAALDLLALILNMGMMTPINKLTMRITFMSATLFVLIFNPALQGQLTSILTKPGSRNVENLKDLRDNGYHIYSSSPHVLSELIASKLWDDESFKKYVHPILTNNPTKCLDDAEKNSSIACLVDFGLFDKIKPDFHISKEFSYNYYVYATSRTWPLSKRMNKIAMKLFESGQSSYFEKRSSFRNLMKQRKKLKKIRALQQYDQLDLENSALVYISIALSAAWAILVFGIEVMIRKIEVRLGKRLREAAVEKLMIRKRIMATVNRITFLDQQV
ncbi:uncharacterized protein LOC130669663 [Microplitis mediator]|uniref:uncharacterized protein LOC130669663 n=1 Tax=Microplitis mediator TaxID=375433 RepID=UPI002556CBE2|nr:uncharacterized protein LOC130669663 [Microplitis mediator]